MRKNELIQSVQEAAALLIKVQEFPRVPKDFKTTVGEFLTDLEAKLTAKSEAGPVIWRLARIVNPKSGREVTLEVRKDGILVRGDAKRLGVTQAPEWDEVRAMNRGEALELIAKGQAEHFSLNGKGPAKAPKKPARKPRSRKGQAQVAAA